MSEPQVGAGAGEPRPSTTEQTGSAKQMAADAARTVKDEAASFAGGAREKAAEKLEQQKETATRTLGDFANAIRRAGYELDGADQTMATQLVRQAADGLEGFARTVADKRPEELLDAVRDFGRRNPTAFIAGSVLAGIAIGRFLKSSSPSSASVGAVDEVSAPAGAPSTLSGASSEPNQTGLYDPMLDPAGFVDPTAAGATSVGASDSEDEPPIHRGTGG